MYYIHNWDTNRLEPKRFRLGKHEKDILRTLLTYKRVGSYIFEWQSPAWRYSLGNYVDENDIEAYNNGLRVPYWVLKRDLELSPATLSRSLKTLSEKCLLWLLGADMELVRTGDKWDRSFYVKYVKLTRDGERTGLTLTNQQLES